MTSFVIDAALERWANIGERSAPVAFVGREREIDLVIAQLANWRPGLSAGRTIVIQGAPGVGKTALLHQIGRVLPKRLPNAVAIGRPTPWNRRSVGNVLRTLAARMIGTTDEFCTATETEGTNGARAAATAQHSRSRSTTPPALSCWDDLETLFADRAEQARPTLLLVDEIQRMGDDEETKDLLYHLHDQTTFPVVLICGGLSTSAAHLRELGLSRLADGNVLRIDALTTDEAEQCLEESLRMMADDVGIDGHADHWARRLAPATHGWPQHVTCHIRAAASALRASDRLAFDDGNLNEAAALAEAAMRDYYEQRLEASATDAMIVFAVHQSISRRAIRRNEVIAVVDSVRPLLRPEDSDEHDRTFPHPRDCVERMLHAGVIAYAGATTTSSLSIPIPSMAAHVAGLLSSDQREEVGHTLGLPPA